MPKATANLGGCSCARVRGLWVLCRWSRGLNEVALVLVLDRLQRQQVDALDAFLPPPCPLRACRFSLQMLMHERKRHHSSCRPLVYLGHPPSLPHAAVHHGTRVQELFGPFPLLLRVCSTAVAADGAAVCGTLLPSTTTVCVSSKYVVIFFRPPLLCLLSLVFWAFFAASLPQIPTAVRPSGETQPAGRPPVRHGGCVRPAGEADRRRPGTGNRRPPARLPRQRLRGGKYARSSRV